jgi:Tat protein secretion system quality control protein TatD with DNase activity
LTGDSLTRIGLGGVDWLLAIPVVSVLFTAFAVGGMANAINIIDGLNGLASGTVLLCLSALGLIAFFAGDAEMAKICAQAGWYMSIPGVVTFKNAQQLRDAVLEIPDHLLLVETDSPFLAPMPHRGKRNESSYIPLIAQKVADIKNISIEEVQHITTKNATYIFEN